MHKLVSIKKGKLVYKNVYYFNYTKKDSTTVSFKYFTRIFYFFRLLNFFKRNGYNKNLILKIFINNYYYIWLLFLQNYNSKHYYLLIKKIILKYNLITSKSHNFIITNINLKVPTHFLVQNNINTTKYEEIDFKEINFKQKIINNNLNNKININQKESYGLNLFTIHFIRVQRRYNKRRYSKVRAYSKPSFFAGITLSSIFSGLL
jgi:hypothetical protein